MIQIVIGTGDREKTEYKAKQSKGCDQGKQGLKRNAEFRDESNKQLISNELCF